MATTYQAPGVYVEEIPPVARPIAGVGTSTAAFIGEADRVAPAAMGKPTKFTNWSEFASFLQGPNPPLNPPVYTAANRTLGAAERNLGEDAPLQQDLRQTLREVNRAAASIKVLTDTLEQHPQSLLRGKSEEKK